MFTITELREHNIKNGLGIKLAYVAYLELSKSARQDPVTHNITEIMAVVNGKGVFNVDGDRHEVTKGDLFIVNADTVHNEEGVSDNFGVYIIGLENYSLGGGDTKVYKLGGERVCYYTEQIVKDYERKGKDFYENANLLFSLIINDVLEVARRVPVPNVKRGSNELINSVKKYLDGHFLEDLSIKSISERFFVNKTTLMHAFKKHVGVSVIDYVIQKRLQESKNWLRISDMTVAQISERCNFSNPSYYVQYFKKQYNLTPIEYRKAKKQGE
ncbi:MAG: helix-turn-helix transcriptional regulator [Clostridia bacterium]|nr:helix-turn-helix transcriptional regulator [Clostridia bacterium]